MCIRNWPIIVIATFLAANVSTKASLPGQTIIYSDFGAGLTYGTSVVWGVEGASLSSGYRGQAQYFTPSFDCYLSYAELATYHQSGSPLSNFFIAADNGSGAPGTILESFANVTTPTGLLTLTSLQNPLLTAGTTYWLGMEPGANNTLNGWFENNQNVEPAFAFERSQGGWTGFGPPSPPAGTFEIVAAPVPEPSAAGLLIFGAIGFARSRSLRRFIGGSSAGPVNLAR